MRNPSLTEFYQMMVEADWFYAYSDDPGQYRVGRDQVAAIEAAADTSPDHAALFIAFSNAKAQGGTLPPRPSEQAA